MLDFYAEKVTRTREAKKKTVERCAACAQSLAARTAPALAQTGQQRKVRVSVRTCVRDERAREWQVRSPPRRGIWER